MGLGCVLRGWGWVKWFGRSLDGRIDGMGGWVWGGGVVLGLVWMGLGSFF